MTTTISTTGSPPTLLVGLTGAPGTGKRLAGRYIGEALERRGFRVTTISLREPVIAAAQALVPTLRFMRKRDLRTPIYGLAGQPLTPSDLLVQLEHAALDINADMLLSGARLLLSNFENGPYFRAPLPLACIVPDVVRAEEHDWVMDKPKRYRHHGVIVRVLAGDDARLARLETVDTAAATALPRELPLCNDGTEADLQHEVDLLVARLVQLPLAGTTPVERRRDRLEAAA